MNQGNSAELAGQADVDGFLVGGASLKPEFADIVNAADASGPKQGPINVGINGFGRIGRLALRWAMADPLINVVSVNDPFITPDYMQYMYKYDSAHGRAAGEIGHDDHHLIIDGHKIRVTNELEPGKCAWGDAGSDMYVIESTGKFLAKKGCDAHID